MIFASDFTGDFILMSPPREKQMNINVQTLPENRQNILLTILLSFKNSSVTFCMGRSHAVVWVWGAQLESHQVHGLADRDHGSDCET